MRCTRCGESVDVRPYDPAYVIVCPKCLKLVTFMSEYGFGPCYPTAFYLGYRKVGQLSQTGKYPELSYVLSRIDEKDIKLEKKRYPDMVSDAFCMVMDWLEGND